MAPRAGAAAGQAAAPQTLYWLYRRPGGVQLVLTLNQRGLVTAITLNGTRPYPPGQTSKGIGLGSAYPDLIRRYGYPDRAVTSGLSLDLTYIDHGVKFRLDGMRVTQITIGAYVETAAPPAPAKASGPTAPPAGMSLPELKGYM